MCYELLDAYSNLVRIIGIKICSYTVSDNTPCTMIVNSDQSDFSI